MSNEIVHVLAGVMMDTEGSVLVAQRPVGRAMAGAWEFPGGKLEPGEERFCGLARELHEELGILVDLARPLIRYRHSYLDLAVDLDVWRVKQWSGELTGREGQEFRWCAPGELLELGLLPADTPVVRAIQLPDLFAVTPPLAAKGEESFLDQLQLISGDARIRQVCLRRPDLDSESLIKLAAGAACRIWGTGTGTGTGTGLVLHGDPDALGSVLSTQSHSIFAEFKATVAGLHVPSRYLKTLKARPVPGSMWFGVSCHNACQLKAAIRLDADYAFLGPVNPTTSHEGELGMGWQRFASLVAELPLPVYAIGGLAPGDLDTAWAAGAQGIAAIRGLWPD